MGVTRAPTGTSSPERAGGGDVPEEVSRERAWHVNRMSLPSPLDRTPPKVLVEGEAGRGPLLL